MTTPAGVCRFCGCSDFDPCPAGCAWIDAGRRVCFLCASASKAEGQALRVLRKVYVITDAWLAAFHLGFLVGWFQISARSRYSRNPFSRAVIRRGKWTLATRAEAWQLGKQAGAEASRAYVTACGPVPNAPRMTMLRIGLGTTKHTKHTKHTKQSARRGTRGRAKVSSPPQRNDGRSAR